MIFDKEDRKILKSLFSFCISISVLVLLFFTVVYYQDANLLIAIILCFSSFFTGWYFICTIENYDVKMNNEVEIGEILSKT